jgi:hypothetical protein
MGLRKLNHCLTAAFLLTWLCACDAGHETDSAASSPPTPQAETKPMNSEEAKTKPLPLKPLAIEPDPVTRPPYVELLWKTTLGQSYNELLFSDYPRELFPSRSERLALRIASDKEKYTARMAAIQIMNEDLYVTQRMNDDIRAKIHLLETAIQSDREDVQKSAVKTVLTHVPFVFLASLPMGSPMVRSEIDRFLKGWSAYALSRMRNKFAAPPAGVKWRALLSTRALENYEIGKPAGLFFQAVAPYSVIELFLVQDVAGDLTGDTSLEKMILMADF